ncbi:HBL347Cp [Eremothecium sinecaudum]|uniref:rRNA biogenesis protein RRP36 n=1 Tax=Eremothecium sinecaudum TaxID=45286 RepID=A0A120K0P5_9SACH|nr:HBL347Cp [Eremothecium sinecaudum]AMD18555.1 HBL347Cp [Eremothecium sinecaudum]
MSFYFKDIKPGYDSAGSDDELSDVLNSNRNNNDVSSDSEDDDLSSLTFGSLKKAQDTILTEERGAASKTSSKRKPNKVKPIVEKESDPEESGDDLVESEEQEDSGSEDSEGDFFEEGSNQSGKKKTRKHAPKEQSSKKRVPKVREIPGLNYAKRENQLYTDIRFDKSMGKPENFAKVRSRYGFLDEYRQKEIDELKSMLADRKLMSKISEREKEEMEARLISSKSKLQSIQNRELETKIVKDYEQEINKNNKGKFHLKKSEKRKVVQKWKFDNMKSKQREKVMERKRKKRLGKEFRSFEFHNR